MDLDARQAWDEGGAGDDLSPVAARLLSVVRWLDGHYELEGMYRSDGRVDEVTHWTVRIMSSSAEGSDLIPAYVGT